MLPAACFLLLLLLLLQGGDRNVFRATNGMVIVHYLPPGLLTRIRTDGTLSW